MVCTIKEEKEVNKVLTLDIETRPGTAYVWSLWDKMVPTERVIDEGGILCVAAKFLGEKTVFFSEWTDGNEGMLQGIYDMIIEADAVVTYNGDRFDLPKLRGAFVKAGLPPMPPVTSIDVYKTVKKFGYLSGKLAFVGPLLGLGNKVPHEGFSLWKKVLAGDPKAQKRMEKYCRGDVTLLEKLYLKIKPAIEKHPYTGTSPGTGCPSCGSSRIQSRGYRRTKAFKIQRLQCQGCGSWSDGQRTKWTS